MSTTGVSDDARRYVVADVFTSTPLEGNQLAVFTDGEGLRPSRCSGLPVS